MKHIILIVILLALAAGCTTSKRCLAKFPPTTTIRVETDTVTEYKDTTFYEYIRADSVFVFDTTYIFPDTITIAPITATLPLAHSTAWIDDGRLNLGLWIDSTTLQFKIDSAMATVTVTDSVFIDNTIPPAPVSPWKGRAIWMLSGALFISMGLFVLAWKMK